MGHAHVGKVQSNQTSYNYSQVIMPWHMERNNRLVVGGAAQAASCWRDASYATTTVAFVTKVDGCRTPHSQGFFAVNHTVDYSDPLHPLY